MGMIAKLLGRETRDLTGRDPELARAFGGLEVGGRLVNARMAENLSTVLACVSAISTAIGSLPAYVYRTGEQGRDVDRRHPLARLIRLGPNPYQTWPDWIEWTLAQVLLRGNSLSEIVTDRTGRVVELRPIPWEFVSVQLLPSGRLAYDVTEVSSLYGGTGRTKRLLQGEVFHLRDRSDDGYIGRSRLQRAGAVVSAGLSVQEFSTGMWEHQATPSGVVEIDGKLTTEQLKRLADHFRQMFTGTSNAKKVMVLDQGLKWKPISVSPEDAELLASRRFSTEELARLFGCPPPIIGDLSHGTFTNSETAGRWFAQHTLTPWCRKLEAELARSVFSAAAQQTHEVEFDLSGLMRGDPEARWQAHAIAVSNDILTRNEVREIEGWNPRPDGDGAQGQGVA